MEREFLATCLLFCNPNYWGHVTGELRAKYLTKPGNNGPHITL